MSRNRTSGHISVKGETYWAFKAACEAANSKMGPVLDELILATLDGDLTEETAYWEKLNSERLEEIKTRSHRYQKKAKAKKVEETFELEVSQEQRSIDPPQLFTPEHVLASFYHRFGMPGPVASILPNEVEPTPQVEPGSIFLIPEKDDPYHVEVKPRIPKPERLEYKPPIQGTGASFGLFSEEGLKMAEAAPKNDPVTPRAHGSRAEKTISLSEAKSCIDPTWGKK